MAKLSLGKAWEETLAFVKREAGLLFPVALLFMALPMALLQYLVPPGLAQWMPGKPMPALPTGFKVMAIAAVLSVLFGTLAVNALALKPGISVREALGLGGRRLLVLIGAGALIIGGLMAVTLVLALVIAAAGISLGMAGSGMQALISVSTLICTGIFIFVGIRLLLLNIVVIDRPVGPIQALRQSWRLARGAFWRLFGFMIVLTLLATIVSQAAEVAFGVIAGLIAGAAAAKMAGALAAAIVSAVIQVYALVMLTRLYRQVEVNAV